jgi:hypothetical protein
MNYYKEGDKLLVLLKEDDTEHIVQVNDVDKGNATCTYEFKCLYGSYSTFNICWINNADIEIIKKATDSDIDDFCEENEIKFKIGDDVIADGKTQNVELYDTDDSEYRLDGCGWYNEEDLEAIEEKEEVIKFSVGDKILVEYEGDKHILKIINAVKYDSYNTFKVECLYGNYIKFHTKPINLKEVTTIKKVTDKDINLFCEENEISKRIGDEVIYCNQKQTIIAYDTDDAEYLLNNEDWCKEYHFEDKIDLNYSIGSIVLINDSDDKHIVKIIDTDDVSDFPYKVECLYGEHGAFDGEWIKESDISKSLNVGEIENYLVDDFRIKYRIGQKVFFNDKEVVILCYDTNDKTYLIKEDNRWEKWVGDSDIKAHFFNEGDLVKIKKFPDYIVRIGHFYDDGNIEVICVIGDYGNIDDYYKPNDLESVTQAEVDILQKDFLFKVGEKVLYGEDRTEYFIFDIDTSKSTDLLYYLGERCGYVSEKEIFKIVKEVEEVLVSKTIGKPFLKWEKEVKYNPTTFEKEEKVVEVKQEIRPRRRLLLG